MTNRALVLAALAHGKSTIHGALRSRDTQLMCNALHAMGVGVTTDETSHGSATTTIEIQPHPLRGATVDCGLAGTVMRFLPPVAALASDTVLFDGDPRARQRPMKTITAALRSLGVTVDGDSLPLTVHGCGTRGPRGGRVRIDASESSQFVSGLLLSGMRYADGIEVHHTGSKRLPSMPHIEMTVAMLRQAGAHVTEGDNSWHVAPGPVKAREWHIEPDLSNATPFLAAAAVTGGHVRIHDWPSRTTQAGDTIRHILERMGAELSLESVGSRNDLIVQGPSDVPLQAIELDMSDIGELAPTVAAVAACASGVTTLSGIAHLRGHETDRLSALSTELSKLGIGCEERADGLRIHGLASPGARRPHGGVWKAYADHRMATAGAIMGLVIPEVCVDDIATTSKTMPGFELMWEDMITYGSGHAN